MNRRNFIAAAAAGISSSLSQARASGRQAVRLAIDTSRLLNVIPADFIGLGYEISSVSIPGLLSAQNRTYVQLVRELGSAGVVRIGGNTSDYASYSPTGTAVSSSKGTVVTDANLKQLAEFLDATGWKLIWGLNLGSKDEPQVVAEALTVSAAAKDKLLAFEIGNEPDLFGRGEGHRPRGYNLNDYLEEYRRFKTLIRAKLPRAPFAGPDVASATDWVTRFSKSEGSDLKLLTHHYYRQCVGPTSSLDKLLNPDPKLAPELQKLKAASIASRLPYRICETNSFCGGGQPGVSDTFGAALWVLDFMFTLASFDCAGVNIETGVNQLDFVSSYSPIADNSAKPVYYGMLAFTQASRGQMVTVDSEARDINLNAYAVSHDQHGLSVTIINKDESQDADVTIAGIPNRSKAKALRLTAPSLTSKDGIALGGAVVSANGDWKPTRLETARSKGGVFEIHVPAASAAIVTWSS